MNWYDFHLNMKELTSVIDTFAVRVIILRTLGAVLSTRPAVSIL